MRKGVSCLWRTGEPDRFWLEFDRVLEVIGNRHGIFFRADDVGIPGSRFERLLEMFRRHQVSLNLAAVPKWVDSDGRDLVRREAGNPLWNWQMHGVRHMSFVRSGKKSEFCYERTRADKRSDLEFGMEIMDRILGHVPEVFTPPWNRCDSETLTMLPELGFKGVSRFWKPTPATPPELYAQDMLVDLHTLKGDDPEACWEFVLQLFLEGIAKNNCGVMIHHERMNDKAFEFLEQLLERIQPR